MVGSERTKKNVICSFFCFLPFFLYRVRLEDDGRFEICGKIRYPSPENIPIDMMLKRSLEKA